MTAGQCRHWFDRAAAGEAARIPRPRASSAASAGDFKLHPVAKTDGWLEPCAEKRKGLVGDNSSVNEYDVRL